MKAADKAQKLAMMPENYRPSKPLAFVGLDMEKARGFMMLSDAEAGQVIKRLYTFAEDYAASYDASMQPDTDGLSEMAGFMLELYVNAFRRMEDERRETSFLRSGNNGGGRPPIDET